MAQIVDIAYRAKAASAPLNQRFQDITGPAVMRGFRLDIGSDNFLVSLLRGEYTSSVAVTPSGVRVEETTDLLDILSVQPNTNTSGSPRVDSIYLVYQFGPTATSATYMVIQGTDVPASNPDINNYLLLGYVYVQPNSYPLQSSSLVSVPYGFSKLDVAGEANFSGNTKFSGNVTFSGPVTFADGTTGGGGSGSASSAFIQRLASPIIATAGQQTFTLPSTYQMNTNALFVFKDGKEVPPSEFQETDNTTFKFYTPLVGGENIWAYWYQGIALYTPAEHNHDDRYYQKWEISNRAVRYVSDYFNGSTGRTINHYLGNTNYTVISVTPTTKSTDVGDISVDKRADSIIVYNTGSYRGQFDLTYMLDLPYDYTPTNEDLGFLNSTASVQDNTTNVYTVVTYTRSDGTIYLKSTLSNQNAAGRYTTLKMDYYNTGGNAIVKSITYALNYDNNGTLISKDVSVIS